MESILTSIKKLLGIEAEVTDFDVDIIIGINTAFSRLNQLGVGPEEGFSIEDEYQMWENFIGTSPKFNDVKTYIYLKTKLVFDPPLSSSVLSAMERQIQELECLLNISAETNPIRTEEV